VVKILVDAGAKIQEFMILEASEEVGEALKGNRITF
jgi:hypothetical protein